MLGTGSSGLENLWYVRGPRYCKYITYPTSWSSHIAARPAPEQWTLAKRRAADPLPTLFALLPHSLLRPREIPPPKSHQRTSLARLHWKPFRRRLRGTRRACGARCRSCRVSIIPTSYVPCPPHHPLPPASYCALVSSSFCLLTVFCFL